MKKKTYDRYGGRPQMEQVARALSDLLFTAQDFPITMVSGFEPCPRCGETVTELRQEPKFKRVMVFCKQCHYFCLWDQLGRIKTFSREDYRDPRPLTLPKAGSPDRPLERAIHSHMRKIRLE